MVADNAVEGTGSELNAKAGRKALLLGVPCRTATGPVLPATGENVVLSTIEEQLWKGLKGDYSGQINEANVGESWKPLVKAVNDVNRKLEEENTEILRLRMLEEVSSRKESQLSELSVLKESVFIKNPMPLLLLDPSQQIQDVNEAFCRVSGISPEELKTMNYQDLKISTTRGNGVPDVLKFKRHNVSELVIDFPSGAHAFEQYSIPMITDSGSLSGIMVVFYDKTASLQEEEQMKSEIQELKLLLEEESKKKDLPLKQVEIPVIPDEVIPATDPGIAITPPVNDDKQQNAKKDAEKSLTFDVVEFELCGEKYALDINLAREIVEMMPITPIPCSPDYLRGIMNLRGEITNIINITTILGLPARDENSGNKIIVLSAEATGGENIGVIVDDVQSVIQINERDVEHLGEGLSSQSSMHIKGIIKIGSRGVDKKSDTDEKDLVIWLDMLKVIEDLSYQKAH
jgi:purine-binding chemotaxis protein CheW